MSGSFIVSGQCHARLDKVGEDSYISRLTLEAKEMQQGEQSEMIRSLDRLVKCVGIAIIPIGIILFVQAFFFQHSSFRSSVTSMIAAVIGMIPGGAVSAGKCGTGSQFYETGTEKGAAA